MLNTQIIGHWFKYPDIKPPKKGVYLVCLKSARNEKDIAMCSWYQDWELSRMGKIKGYEITYWTHIPSYPEEVNHNEHQS